MSAKAYLEITMVIDNADRGVAAKVYTDYRQPFLAQIDGAVSKDLLIRDEDVQVLHGFSDIETAMAYLDSKMFKDDVFVGLQGLWKKEPDVKIYSAI